MENLSKSIRDLPWWLLMLLVIFADGFVGGVVRIAGKQTISKVVGWILLLSFAASIVSFISLPFFVAKIVRIVYAVCLVADIITVAVNKDFVLFAD